MFDRTIWNFHNCSSNRTNNISETYNIRINGQVVKPKPNIFNIADTIKNEENLTSVSYEKENLGKIKSRRTKNELKDVKIESFKIRYVHGEIEVMDFLMSMISFVADFD